MQIPLHISLESRFLYACPCLCSDSPPLTCASFAYSHTSRESWIRYPFIQTYFYFMRLPIGKPITSLDVRAWLVFFQLLRHDWLINFRNQARFENQSTIANFSKLTPCVFCNTLSPHDPRAALLFASVYAIRLRDFDEQALDSLREKTFSFTFQLAFPLPSLAKSVKTTNVERNCNARHSL